MPATTMHHATRARLSKLGLVAQILADGETYRITNQEGQTMAENKDPKAAADEAIEKQIAATQADQGATDGDDADEGHEDGAEDGDETTGAGDTAEDTTTAEGEADEAEDEGKGKGSVVRPTYRQKYKEIGAHDSNGDALALAFRDFVTVETPVEGKKPVVGLSMERLQAVADANGIDMARWAHQNNGQKRMNLGNVLRGVLRQGKSVAIGEQSIEPTEEAKKAAAERFAAEQARTENQAKAKADREAKEAEKKAAREKREAERAAKKEAEDKAAAEKLAAKEEAAA